MPDGKRFFAAVYYASCQSKILGKFYNIPIVPVCVKLIFLGWVKAFSRELNNESKPGTLAGIHA
jgi:hypothetical protein